MQQSTIYDLLAAGLTIFKNVKLKSMAMIGALRFTAEYSWTATTNLIEPTTSSFHVHIQLSLPLLHHSTTPTMAAVGTQIGENLLEHCAAS